MPETDDAADSEKASGFRVFRFRDFRLLWIGAFVSFTGSWIENVAVGHTVFSMTHDEGKLAAVSFAWSLPVFALGLVAGPIVDRFNKRALLIWAQVIMGSVSISIAVAIWTDRVQYWLFLLAGFMNGSVASVEMPARHSCVSRVVPESELASAVPVNAMTFNFARVVGPAIGGVLLAIFGAGSCFFVNGLSFLALVWAVAAIRSNLKATREAQGKLTDLFSEGIRYVWREPTLRALLLLESMTAVFGLAYQPLLPAYVQEVLHLVPVQIAGRLVDPSKAALGNSYTAIGIGAVAALLLVSRIADRRRQMLIIRCSIGMVTIGLATLAWCSNPFFAYAVMGVIGFGVVSQFNITNSLVQTIAPERLRGRALAVHIWTLNGISPFGALALGTFASLSRNEPYLRRHLTIHGVQAAIVAAGCLMTVALLASLLWRPNLPAARMGG